MGEPNVAIGELELNRIGEYVQSHLPDWMERLGVRAPQDPVTNTQLLERVVRVEEELKAQRDIMITKFEASDARIGDLIKTVDDRFKTVDDRFRSAAKASDDRFTDLIKTMDDRFASLDDRFAGVNRHIGVVKWFVISSFVVLGSIISLVAILQ